MQRTIGRQLTLAKRALQDGKRLPDSALPGLHRWLQWAEIEKPELNTDDLKLLETVKSELKKKPSRVPKERKLEARSFTADDLAALAGAIIEDDSPEGHVLHVLLDTGLRIGDILRIPTEDLKIALREGILDARVKGGRIVQIPIAGARETWWKLYRALRASGKPTVAWWICPEGNGSAKAGGAAYQRVNRKFKALGDRVGVHGRVHLHRLRRSFAVDALRESGDIIAVQQALGHRSLTSTQKYTDELRVDDVAKLQQAIREKRKNRK